MEGAESYGLFKIGHVFTQVALTILMYRFGKFEGGCPDSTFDEIHLSEKGP